MISTPHLLVGAAIALHIKPVTLAAALAVFSHYILDAIPHWDYSTTNIRRKKWRKSLPAFFYISLDFSFGILLIILLTKNWFLALTGAFFAVLPDVITFFYLILPNNKTLQTHEYFHHYLHWFRNKKIPLFWKVSTQLIIIALSIFLLLSCTR